MLDRSKKLKTTLEVVEKFPISKGIKLTLNDNESFQITNTTEGPEVVVLRLETKPFTSEAFPNKEKFQQYKEKLSEKIEKEIKDNNSEEESSAEQIKQEKIKKLEEEHLEEELKEEFEFRQKWQLKPGFWYLNPDKGLVSSQIEDELYFETRTSKKLLNILRTFLKNHSKMTKYKKMKRAYLLHSDPGMGKSALIRYFCREALKSEGTCVLRLSGELDFKKLHHIFIMDYHPNTKHIILVIEDFGKKDYSYNQNFYNPSCLNFLDGDTQLFRVPTLILTTTNFAKELGSHLTNRPGRFNQIIKVLPPTDEEVYELAEYYLDRPLQQEEKQALAGKQLTPDHCLEAIIRSEIEETSIAAAVEEMIKERKGIVDWDRDS